jgi:hypothetical protein
MPRARTPEVEVFREVSMVSFLSDLVEHTTSRGVRSTLCLTPGESGPKDWDRLAAIPHLDTLAASPYWARSGKPTATYVGDVSREVRRIAHEQRLSTPIWIQGFGLGPRDLDDVHVAVRAAREAGVDELWTWGYEACSHMDALGTVEPETVWAALSEALTARP